jgi:hypothetical protein
MEIFMARQLIPVSGQAILLSTLFLTTVSSGAVPDCASQSIHCVGPGQEFDTAESNHEVASQAAADAAGPGDYVRIKGGHYFHDEATSKTTTFLLIRNSGTDSAPITFAPFDGESVLITGFGFTEGTEGPSRTNERLIEVHGDYIHLRNLELEYSSRFGLLISGSYGLFEELEIHDSWNDNIIVVNRGDGTNFNVVGNIIRNVEVYRSRHNYGIRLTITTSGTSYINNNVVEYSLSHHNGYQPDGQKVPPISGDPSGGGNSDGINFEKFCHDAAPNLGASNICGNNLIRGNVVWKNADDGIDVSFGNGSRVINNISFNNGPEGNKGFKVLRSVTGGVSFLGNVSFANDSRGYELQAEDNLVAINNTALSHPIQEYVVTVRNGAGAVVNNASVTLGKSSPEFSLSDGIRAASNWSVLENGDPKVKNPNFNMSDVSFEYAPNMRIGQKVAFLRQQFAQALIPAEGSPLIDAGTFEEGIHCTTADDDPDSPMPPSADCRHWLGVAPDIGAFEYNSNPITRPAPPDNLNVEISGG